MSQSVSIARRTAGAGRGPAAAWRRRRLTLWGAAVGLLALVVAASLAAPLLAETALHIALVRSLGTADVAVTVRATPALALWWGDIAMLSVVARSVHLGQLAVAAFDATLRHVDVDAGLLYGSRRLAIRSVGNGVARVVVTPDNLAQLVASQPAVKRVVVHVQPGAIVVDGAVTVFGADVPVSLVGRLVVRDAAHLDLAVDRVTVMGGVTVPPDAAGRLAASVNPVLDVGRLPFNLRLTGVTMGDGVVTLQAVAGTASSVTHAR
jgi:hypothetical protein